jgi:hypothetical protein
MSLGLSAGAWGKGASYDVKGKYYETCACAVSCPCATNATLPTEGHCDGVSLIHIEKGSVGKTKLDGLNLAVVLRSPKGKKVMDSFNEGVMDLLTVYIDDKATPEQRAAIPGLMGGLFGTKEIKGEKPPQFAPMELTIEGDTAKFTIAGGTKLSFEINNIALADTTKMGAKNPGKAKRLTIDGAVPFPWVKGVSQGISKSFKYNDLGAKWE